MRRTTIAVAATAALGAALTFGTAHAHQAATEGGTPVVNKNGHEVDAHATHGQARAAEARAQHASEDPSDEPTEATEATDEPTEAAEAAEATDETTEPTEAPRDPNEHAGTHPDTHALPGGTDHGQDGLEHGHHASGLHQGNGPDEHAEDHPNEHANGPTTDG